MVPIDVLESDEYASLSFPAKALLLDLAGQFRGRNNGQLSIAWKLMQPVGWRSKTTLYRAAKELLRADLIRVTRAGNRKRCTLYALTYREVHECGDKLDVASTKSPLRTFTSKKNLGSSKWTKVVHEVDQKTSRGGAPGAVLVQEVY